MKKNIKNNKFQHEITKKLEIPDLIKNKNDFYEFEKSTIKPNFVQSKDITGKIIDISNLKKLRKQDLENKIILIDSADPGYDFIFSFNILGLITKYGGANSHMSIRCIDEGIPAAIGVGDLVYSNLKNANSVNINAKQKTINIIN
ncbi:PEP-utilizing enzyme [Candidatus Pelagibacter bacterium nBUS_49]|uniref:PEP-utilizing enzyme n=1 Tax=Candidatus Pelagibacter bacterium nBUS_49 TaxID=3374196 RepID=UPI003EB8E596